MIRQFFQRIMTWIWAKFKNKRSVVIYGDSISTFSGGWIPDGYQCFYEGENIQLFGLHDVRDCWWYKVFVRIKRRDRKIVSVINVSYSGSMITGRTFPAGQSYKRITDIAVQQKRKSPDSSPGYIILCMGYNDFGNVIPRNINLLHANNFEDAYHSTLTQLRSMYPAATVLCTTMLTTTVAGRPDWCWPESEKRSLDRYNDAIRFSAEKVNGCKVVDLAKWAPTPFETIDGIHPNQKGHQQVADAFIKCLDRMELG